MMITRRNKGRETAKFCKYISIMLIVIIPSLIVGLILKENFSTTNEYINENSIPTSAFSKSDYEEILAEEKHGLGSILATNIEFDSETDKAD